MRYVFLTSWRLESFTSSPNMAYFTCLEEMFNLAPRVIINISNVTAAQLSSLTRPVRYPKDKQTIAPTTGASEPRTCVLRPHQHARIN